MQSIRKILLSCICLSALGGCALAVILSMEPDQRAALFMVPADRGVIYVYEVDLAARWPASEVYVDGEKLAPRSPAGFRYRDVIPGTHMVALASDAEPLLVVVEPGHAYFVEEETDCSPALHPVLHAVAESEGRAHVRALYAASKSGQTPAQVSRLACGRSAPTAPL